MTIGDPETQGQEESDGGPGYTLWVLRPHPWPTFTFQSTRRSTPVPPPSPWTHRALSLYLLLGESTACTVGHRDQGGGR